MTYKFSDLCEKDVVNCSSGEILGKVSDIEISQDNCVVCALYIECNKGLLQKNEEIRIPWENIEKIGIDVILVNFCPPIHKEKHPDKPPKKHFFT